MKAIAFTIVAAVLALAACEPKNSASHSGQTVVFEAGANSDLAVFFSRPRDLDVPLVSPGRETPWLHFANLQQEKTQVLIGDPEVLPEGSRTFSLRLPAGAYDVWVKGIDYGFERRVSRVRYCLAGENLKTGVRMGTAWTDSGTIVVCDLSGVQKMAAGDQRTANRRIVEQTEQASFCSLVRLDSFAFPVFRSGFGDGIFPVYEVLQERRRVGIEVEFISAGMPYPQHLYHAAMQERIFRAKTR